MLIIGCVPTIYYCVTDKSIKGSENHIMIMNLLGSSLEDLLKACVDAMSLNTVLMIALQLISNIRKIHEEGVIHRDIKPENFVMGQGKDKSKVFLIDFGLAKMYMD